VGTGLAALSDVRAASSLSFERRWVLLGSTGAKFALRNNWRAKERRRVETPEGARKILRKNRDARELVPYWLLGHPNLAAILGACRIEALCIEGEIEKGSRLLREKERLYSQLQRNGACQSLLMVSPNLIWNTQWPRGADFHVGKITGLSFAPVQLARRLESHSNWR